MKNIAINDELFNINSNIKYIVTDIKYIENTDLKIVLLKEKYNKNSDTIIVYLDDISNNYIRINKAEYNKKYLDNIEDIKYLYAIASNELNRLTEYKNSDEYKSLNTEDRFDFEIQLQSLIKYKTILEIRINNKTNKK